ncbi:MAG: type II toxin-antitoxin system VapC family toxin [Bryobacterales bacterium]|nr:type II toxin-antitoxin system VapC family toxin [Bryobacterales bacterium]MDE0262306.1 type II toxin-antitoxin system VapC family toxin [Bryobacterales bacterium]MDE0623308.1 type II toxin-antitoxin system VapC family toxin [Bryobacterales bacterium]
MRTLLDTHAFLWWLDGSEKLSQSAKRTISDEANEILISAASAWEIATKWRLGRLSATEAVARIIPETIADQGFDELPITVEDATRAGLLPGPHRDPFDRMLIAQALAHELVLISIEDCFDAYGVARLW